MTCECRTDPAPAYDDEPTDPRGHHAPILPPPDLPEDPEALDSLVRQVLAEQANERAWRADEHAAVSARTDALVATVRTLADRVSELNETVRQLVASLPCQRPEPPCVQPTLRVVEGGDS